MDPCSPTISVVIAAYNEEKVIGDLLEDLKNLGAEEIIVADGGSTDRTAEIAARYARVLALPRCRATQMNAGAKASSGDVLLFLHADVRLGPGALKALRSDMCNSVVIIVTGRSWRTTSLRGGCGKRDDWRCSPSPSGSPTGAGGTPDCSPRCGAGSGSRASTSLEYRRGAWRNSTASYVHKSIAPQNATFSDICQIRGASAREIDQNAPLVGLVFGVYMFGSAKRSTGWRTSDPRTWILSLKLLY